MSLFHPPSLPVRRLPLLCPASRLLPRHFSITRPRPTFLDTTTTLLTTFHTSPAYGLSWGALIPITAVTLRLLFTFPITLHSRRIHDKLTDLRPISFARAHLVARYINANYSLHPRRDKLYKKAVKSYEDAMHKRWNTQRWKLFVPALVQLPVWFVASATLRALLPGEHQVDWLRDLMGGGGVVAEDIAGSGFMWIDDLASADPTLFLPGLFAATVLANVRFNAWERPTASKWGRRWTNGLSVAALGMGLVVVKVPAALVLYWLTSAGWSLGVHVVLWALGRRKVRKAVKLPGEVGKQTVWGYRA